jgi:hypothetical protein
VPDLPLLGFVCAPLHRHVPRASTPDGVTTAFGLPVSRPIDSFRPRGFAPPRRFPPHRGSRACCIPLPVLGFVAFPASVAAAWPKPATVDGKRSPRRVSHPSKNPPRLQPYRVTTALAFLPLPNRRPTGAPVHRSGPPHRPFDPPRALLRAKGVAGQPAPRPCSTDESVASHPRCRGQTPYPPMGFVPLQGPSERLPEGSPSSVRNPDHSRGTRGPDPSRGSRPRARRSERCRRSLSGAKFTTPRRRRPSWGF